MSEFGPYVTRFREVATGENNLKKSEGSERQGGKGDRGKWQCGRGSLSGRWQRKFGWKVAECIKEKKLEEIMFL